MTAKKYIRLGIVFLIPLAFTISQCFHKTEQAVAAISTDPRGPAFAGAAACLKCHSKITEDYLHTNHFKTSRVASAADIGGSFSPGSNLVDYGADTKVIMEKSGDSIFQAKYKNGVLMEKEPFDITFGSKQAETFLYWKSKFVFELPVTYYKNIHKWANSPGFSGDIVIYNRLIGETCFECHSSYIEQVPPTEQEIKVMNIGLKRSSMLLGIDCERCHGPASQHANFHAANPAEKKPMYIKKIEDLTRAQRTDLCGQCHSGINPILWSTYDFKPGDSLSKYKDKRYINEKPDFKKIDVHGNQVGLMTNSKCFLKGTLECGTCHNMHETGIKTVQLYSKICTTCHSEAKHNFCTMAGKIGSMINTNCVDCHMPVKNSNSIVLNEGNHKIDLPFSARMHRIAIYPEETRKVMTMLKSEPAKSISN